MKRLLDWWRWRDERRWARRDPHGYLRGILDLGPEVTDEDMELAVARFTEAMQASMITSDEAAARLVALGHALRDSMDALRLMDERVTNGSP